MRAFSAALLLLGLSVRCTGLIVEDDEVGAGESTLVQQLDIAAAKELVRTAQPYVVMVSAGKEKCPACEAYLPTLESAARLSKGVAKFGTVNIEDGSESWKILAIEPALGVPHLRVYIAQGKPNAYRKGEFYREHVLMNGLPSSARAIKKFLFDAVSKDAPVREIAVSNAAEIDAVLNGKNEKIVALSAKSQPSAILAALARVMQGRASVVQVSNVQANSPEGKATLGKFGIETLPSFLVLAKTGNWQPMEPTELQNAGVQELVKFVESKVELGEEATGSTTSANADEEATRRDLQRYVLTSSAQMKSSVHASPMPALVAARLSSSAGEMPTDFLKFLSKAHGVTAHIIYCDLANQEGGPEADLVSELCTLAEPAAGTEWSYKLYGYEAVEQGSSPRIRTGQAVDSLGTALTDSLASIPESVMRIPNPEMMSGFVNMAVQSGKAPLILFAKGKDPPAMLLSVAAALQGLVLVGYRVKPSAEELKGVGLPPDTKLPVLIGLTRGDQITEPSGKQGSAMMVAVYDTLRLGPFKYTSLLFFALQLSSGNDRAFTEKWVAQYGKGLGISAGDKGEQGTPVEEGNGAPESRSFDDASTPLPLADSPSSWDSLCSSNASPQMLCVLGLVDASPLNTDLESHKATLQAAREKLLGEPSGAARLRFILVDASCQVSLATALGVAQTALPSLVVFHPKKGLAFKLLQSFSSENIEKFARSLATGVGLSKHSPVHVSQFPRAAAVDCAALPGRADVPAGTVDDVDDDILAEIRAEAERSAAQDQEASGKKRRRRRKASAEKDEL